MTKIVVRTDDVSGFFARAKDAAARADQGRPFNGLVTLSLEDPQRMFAVLSEARRRLMLEVMHEPQTISQHGIQKVVRAVVSKIEMVATLG